MKKALFLMGVVGLIGCESHDTVSIEQTDNQSSNTASALNLDVFQHPVFIGFSEICLPYVEKISLEENLTEKEARATIGGLTQRVGFKKGQFYEIHHRDPSKVYTLGNTEYGAEVEVVYSGHSGRHDGQYCSVSFGNVSAYPSLEAFTKWLNVKNSQWVLREDNSADFETTKTIYATFCKTDNSEYGSRLDYNIVDRELATRRVKRMSIHVQRLQNRPCVR